MIKNDNLKKSILTPFSKVEKRKVEWLVEPYIPKNTFVLVEGEESSGKSTFVSHIVSSLSASRNPISGASLDRAYTSIYISTEEDSSTVLAPRFEAQGGNLENIFMIENPYEIFNNLKEFEKIVKSNKIDILVVDPLSSLTGNIDSNSEREVRQFLEPLTDKLNKLNLTLIGIRHHGKSTNNARRKGLGSVAFSSLVRSIITIYEKDSNSNTRYLTQAKNNFGTKKKTRIFSIEEKGIINFGSEVNITSDELALREPIKNSKNSNKTVKTTKIKKAEELLLKELSNKKYVSYNFLVEQAEKLGISESTLKIAKRNLKIGSVRKKFNWNWFLNNK